MVDTLKLKARIVGAGFTQRKLAEALGMNKNTLSAKVNGNVQFNTEEVCKICSLLNIESAEDKCAIFLHESSHKRDECSRK